MSDPLDELQELLEQPAVDDLQALVAGLADLAERVAALEPRVAELEALVAGVGAEADPETDPLERGHAPFARRIEERSKGEEKR